MDEYQLIDRLAVSEAFRFQYYLGNIFRWPLGSILSLHLELVLPTFLILTVITVKNIRSIGNHTGNLALAVSAAPIVSGVFFDFYGFGEAFSLAGYWAGASLPDADRVSAYMFVCLPHVLLAPMAFAAVYVRWRLSGRTRNRVFLYLIAAAAGVHILTYIYQAALVGSA